jgi:hypothetical protein
VPTQTRHVIPAAPPTFLLLSFARFTFLVFNRAGIPNQWWQALSLVKANTLLLLLCPTLLSLALALQRGQWRWWARLLSANTQIKTQILRLQVRSIFYLIKLIEVKMIS